MPQTNPISWISLIILLTMTILTLTATTQPTNFLQTPPQNKLSPHNQINW